MSSFRRRLMMAAFAGGGGGDDGIHIPSVFQRVEWIESDGYAYIDTGLTLVANNSKVDCTFSLDDLQDGRIIFGVSNSVLEAYTWSNRINGVFPNTGHYFWLDYPVANKPMRFVKDGNELRLYDGDTLLSSDSSATADSSSGLISLFVLPRSSYTFLLPSRIYRFKVTEQDGTPICDLIPCYRKSDGKPGLWDMVTWQFFTNANTSAQTDFTVGPDVIQPPTQYIIFVDRAVEAICVANWGDGVGITPAQAAAVTNLSNKFQNQTGIVSFEEFQYFTGITSITQDAFYGSSNLETLTLPDSVLTVAGYSFFYNAGIKNLTFGSGLAQISGNNILQFNTSARVVMRGSTPPTFYTYTFNMCTITMYVPYSADHSILSAYQTATASLQDVSLTLLELNPDGTIPTS